MNSNQEEIVWFDMQDIMQLLHVSRGTLHNWRVKGILPFSKVGR